MISAATLLNLSRSRDGLAAVETAILLTVYLLFLLGIFEFGRLFWIQTSLQHAAERAARCAIVTPATCTRSNVTTYAAGEVYGMTVPPSAFTYTSGANCGIAGYNTGALV
jgi:Flp pilus assembly protein TadG